MVPTPAQLLHLFSDLKLLVHSVSIKPILKAVVFSICWCDDTFWQLAPELITCTEKGCHAALAGAGFRSFELSPCVLDPDAARLKKTDWPSHIFPVINC